ncbi:DUF418 domain-containing protein [Pedobacter rhodius]|uniref:DUF418 domain-containing protein n=1 Tax=Pedobacter rhodius TaxID=3004098 RepID=A0ABT4L3G3_9SPHI|nr:DUF418 domain-containing protein [Pedobacter sp. SJ11]MCZ4225511.1 DUF418 domain-containing protein [Pedobacter sp. SJ11]
MSELQTTDALTAASPLGKNDRILFLDAVRGIAVLGILLMNSMAMGQSHIFYAFLNPNQPMTGLNYYAWVLEMGFFEGTMRGLFSILFGAGTVLLINRLEKNRGNTDAADIYYRRILWLLVFGLINAYIFFWPGDILYSYALCGLVLFPFRKLSPQILWVGVFILLVIGTYRENSSLYNRKEIIVKGKQVELLKKQNKKLTETQQGDLEKWVKFREKNDVNGMIKDAKEEDDKIQKSSYPKLFAFYRDVNMELQSIGFYNGWWDILMFFFAGMALIKSGFITGEKSNWIYIIGAVLGIGISVAFNFMGIKEMYAAKFDVIKLTESAPAELYQIRRLLQTLGYLCLLILLYKIIPFRKCLNIFVPVGQMAFSNYLMQSIIGGIFFLAFGWHGKLQRYEIYEFVLAIWLFQITFSTIWLRYFLFGPFEWLWRSLTYLKSQPIKRQKVDDTIGVQPKIVVST